MADFWAILGATASAVSAGTTVFAVLYARGQIAAAAALSRAQFIDSLEREYAGLTAIQARLRPNGRWAELSESSTEAESAELESLLSFFEKLHFIERAGVVSLETLDDAFGTRFFETMSNPNATKFVEDTGGAGAWPGLTSLHERWRDVTTRQIDGSIRRPRR